LSSLIQNLDRESTERIVSLLPLLDVLPNRYLLLVRLLDLLLDGLIFLRIVDGEILGFDDGGGGRRRQGRR